MPIEPDFTTLYQLYIVKHMSTRELAKQFGFASKTSIQIRLKTFGIPLRATGGGLLNRQGIEPPDRETLYCLIHVEHKGFREIANMYGVDHTAISYWLKKHNIDHPTVWDTRRKGIHPTLPTEQELRDLYTTGHSLREIGNQFGTSTQSISHLCDQYDIQVKPDGFDGGKRFLCNDDHLVLSVYEQRVDNWLYEHEIPHQLEPRLPFDRRCQSDFLANGWYIEVWGVIGNTAYTQRRIRKTNLYHQHNLPLIELEPYQFDTAHKGLWKRRLQKVLTPSLLVSPELTFDAQQ